MRKSFAVVAGFSLFVSVPALGADLMLPTVKPMRIAVPTIDEDFSSGWYVRGDIGGAMRLWPRLSSSASVTGFSDERFNPAFYGGLGAGFKYQSLRADITGDWRAPAAVSGTADGGNHSFMVGGQTLLVNGYYDIGAFGGFTPYVGLGVGMARLTASSHGFTPSGGTSVAQPSLSAAKTSFAWAVNAGFAINITKQLQVDFGYRYLNTGSFSFADSAGTRYSLSSPSAHEVRLGLRYMFGDGLPSKLLQ